MAKIETSDFRKGLKVLYNNIPYTVVDFQHVKPGKGNQFSRTKLKNLQTGAVLDVTFRSGETLEDPEIEDRKMQFLYHEGDTFHFMDSKTYDQVEIQREVIGRSADFLLPDMICDVVFFKGRALTAEIPAQVELVVEYCEPGVRGDTATNVTKPARMETGVEVNVPLFINTGDKIKVDTAAGSYIERTAIGNG